jgi:hypothetical protein
MNVALPVEGELSPASGVPTNGIEYLMQVRYQARRTRLRPVIAQRRTLVQQQQQQGHTVVVDERPMWNAELCDDWQRALLAKFTALRQTVFDSCSAGASVATPDVNDEQTWRQWICAYRQQPSLRIIASMGDVRVRSVLEFAADWFRERDAVLCERRAQWLFSLLAAVELPLDADTAAALMSLYQSLKRLRARAVATEFAAFDVLLTVIGFGFNQRDDHDASL